MCLFSESCNFNQWQKNFILYVHPVIHRILKIQLITFSTNGKCILILVLGSVITASLLYLPLCGLIRQIPTDVLNDSLCRLYNISLRGTWMTSLQNYTLCGLKFRLTLNPPKEASACLWLHSLHWPAITARVPLALLLQLSQANWGTRRMQWMEVISHFPLVLYFYWRKVESLLSPFTLLLRLCELRFITLLRIKPR